MARKHRLTPYKQFRDGPKTYLRTTHRLLELYRFLDFYFPIHELNRLVSKKWWVKFMKWNRGVFWKSEKHVRKNFLIPAELYLEDRPSARAKLDMTTKVYKKNNQRN